MNDLRRLEAKNPDKSNDTSTQQKKNARCEKNKFVRPFWTQYSKDNGKYTIHEMKSHIGHTPRLECDCPIPPLVPLKHGEQETEP